MNKVIFEIKGKVYSLQINTVTTLTVSPIDSKKFTLTFPEINLTFNPLAILEENSLDSQSINIKDPEKLLPFILSL